jgi:hypothetical protein
MLFQTQTTVSQYDDIGILLVALGFVFISTIVIMGIVLAALRQESIDL